MTTRNDWLDDGLLLLALGGSPALRIEALSRRLGMTKGSFYHHFLDLADYRRALLAHYEESCTRRQITANAQLVAAEPLERLARLADAALAEEEAHRGLEVAVRAWAAQDDDARQTVERVDALRLGYLEQLTVAALDDPSAAAEVARTLYYLLIGSQHAVPPGSVGELRRLWHRLLRQVDTGAIR
jgi:AcrR family transcriptional regulator